MTELSEARDYNPTLHCDNKCLRAGYCMGGKCQNGAPGERYGARRAPQLTPPQPGDAEMINLGDAETLPDCMMPDGAEPCIGYQQLWAQYKATKSALAESQGHVADLQSQCSRDMERMADLHEKFAESRAEVGELQRTLNLMWDADQRAIKRWQDAAPLGEDRSLTWPDRSKLTEWLLQERDEARAEVARLKDAFEWYCQPAPDDARLRSPTPEPQKE